MTFCLSFVLSPVFQHFRWFSFFHVSTISMIPVRAGLAIFVFSFPSFIFFFFLFEIQLSSLLPINRLLKNIVWVCLWNELVILPLMEHYGLEFFFEIISVAGWWQELQFGSSCHHFRFNICLKSNPCFRLVFIFQYWGIIIVILEFFDFPLPSPWFILKSSRYFIFGYFLHSILRHHLSLLFHSNIIIAPLNRSLISIPTCN